MAENHEPTEQQPPFTESKSREEAEKLRMIGMQVALLDTEYLSAALKEMRKSHSFRGSAAILGPNPHTHIERQELEAAKLHQLELFLRLAENTKAIMQCEAKLATANNNQSQLKRIFNV